MKQTIWSTKALNLNQVSKLKHAGNPILIKSFLIFFHSPQFKFNFNNLTNWAMTTTITIKMNWINKLWISIWNVPKNRANDMSALRPCPRFQKYCFCWSLLIVSTIYVSTVFIRVCNQLIYVLYNFLVLYT